MLNLLIDGQTPCSRLEVNEMVYSDPMLLTPEQCAEVLLEALPEINDCFPREELVDFLKDRFADRPWGVELAEAVRTLKPDY